VPILQRLLERANVQFASDRISELDPEAFVVHGVATPDALADCATTLGIARTDPERRVLRSCPIGLQVAILATAHSAVTRSRSGSAPVPITFNWLSGYDFELTIFEARKGRDSWGGVSIVLRTPYPD
jgi:hypothetical protein